MPDRFGHYVHKVSLFLPEIRKEAVIKEASPGRPVVTGFTYAEVLIFDSVLLEGFSERLYAEIEHALLLSLFLSSFDMTNFICSGVNFIFS